MHNGAICVAMQPTYLPWLGYFDLMDQSSIFVFLDNVQFAKRSWQQRNRLRNPQGLAWLTVPVAAKGKRLQHIDEVQMIRSRFFPYKHIRSVALNYARSPFFNLYFQKFRHLLEMPSQFLCTLNMEIIKWLAQVLGIRTTFEVASGLRLQGKRSNLLVEICKAVGADTYLAPMGSFDYLVEEHNVFSANHVQLLFHNYDHPRYHQVFQPFIPYASVLDLLFNEGDRSANIIRRGRRTPLTIEEMSLRSGNGSRYPRIHMSGTVEQKATTI